MDTGTREYELNKGLECLCGHVSKSSYAVAQMASGNALVFTCPDCKRVWNIRNFVGKTQVRATNAASLGGS